jgi:23S rRNA (guanosine2251-2'-O)-methyltransferase
MAMDLIIGMHSIEAALKNPEREEKMIYATEDGLQEFQKKTGMKLKSMGINIKMLKPHDLQEEAKRKFADLDFHYHRILSNLFLTTTALAAKDLKWLYHRIDTGPLRLIALDQVTDVHNAAAILRTAAFFGVDGVLVAMKGNFGEGPTFHRLASGASEFVPLIKCSSLPQALTKLQERNVLCVGLSEHATQESVNLSDAQDVGSRCLVLGAEDVGLSHAVQRVIQHHLALKSQGEIRSLNVSVAAALAMEKFFPAEST